MTTKPEAILRGSKLKITPKLLHRYFEERAEESPDSVALIFEGKLPSISSNYT